MKLQFHIWLDPENSFQMKHFRLFKTKLQSFVLIGLFLLLVQQVLNAKVNGTVFRDFNANSDVTTNGDARDSDASGTATAVIALTTGKSGENNHTYDFGFRAAAACAVTVTSAVPTTCNPATNTYDLAVNVTYSGQPAGDITINVGGTNYTFTPDGTSPDTYTVTGLTANGTTGIDVSATFVGDNACTNTLVDAYNAPVSCAPPFVACGDIPVIWLVDEDQALPSMHLWSFKNYNDATNTGTDYGRVKYYDPTTGVVTDFATTSAQGDMESMAVNQTTGQAYFMTATKITGGPSGTQALFTYNLNDAAANKDNIVFTLLGHITKPHSIGAEVLAFYNNRLYLADPVGLGDNNNTDTDILMYIDLAALNPPMVATPPTIVGTIQGLGQVNNYVDGMEILPDGTLYTVDGTDDHLYRVNLATGAIVEVVDNNLPGGIDPLADIETIVWDPVNNKLIGTDNELQQFVDLTLDGTNGNNTVTSPYIGTPGIYNLVDFEGSAMFVMCCDLTVNSAVPSACDVNGQYTLSVDVTYTNISGDIIINGQTFTPTGVTGRDTFVLTLLTANGAIDVDVTAQSITEATCSATLLDAYNAPASCACNTNTTLLVGDLLQSGGGSIHTFIFDPLTPSMCTGAALPGGEGMAVDYTNDLIYIVDATNDQILKYDVANQTYSVLAAVPCWSYDLDLSSDGQYLYATCTSQIYKMSTSTGTVVATLSETAFSGANNLWGVAVHPITGDVYVTRGFNGNDPVTTGSLSKVDGDLTAGSVTTLATVTDGSFLMGVDISANGTLWVVRDGNGVSSDAVLNYQTNGTLLNTYPMTPDLMTNNAPADIAFGPDGNVYVATWFNYCVVKYDFATSTWSSFIGAAPGSNGKTLAFACGLVNCASSCSLTIDSAVPTACNPATNAYDLAVTVSYANQPTGDITINVGGTNYPFTPDGTSPDTYTVMGLTSNGTTGIDVSATFVGDNTCADNNTYNEPSCIAADLSLVKTVNTAIAQLGSQVTFTLTLTNDNGVDATGVVVTDMLPVGVTFVSTSNPAAVYDSGTHTVVWTVGNFAGTDAPKTLDIVVTASSEGSFVNTTEITSMNENDEDSTPGNNVNGEDDIDQACFSVPIMLCSDSATSSVSVIAPSAGSYQWYVSTDNGATYTMLANETNQTLVVDNTLMGGNGVTKYFKVAYDGADITSGCGNVMCCPIIVTTTTCIVCPPPRCIIMSVTKTN